VALVMAGGLTQVASGPASGQPADHPSRPSRPSLCTRSFNPYKARTSLLRACGDKILTLRNVRRLPGGGKAYDYGAFTELVPPAHFNVLRASDRQLREYGYPTRRQLGRRWLSIMRHTGRPARPEPFLAQAPAAHPAGRNTPPSLNWSGYDVTGHDYLGVSAKWFEPSFAPSPNCSSTAFGQWAGLGLGSPYLGQDGTAFNYPTLGAHQAFVQVLPNDNGPVAVDLYATPGQLFYVRVLWDPANSWYEYFLKNDHTGANTSFHSAPAAAHDGSTAEVITERPRLPPHGVLPGLSNYGQFQVQDATGFWGSSSSDGFNNLTNNAITMADDNNQTMSSPGSLMGSNWNMFFNHCD
jgi:hypothetical protein